MQHYCLCHISFMVEAICCTFFHIILVHKIFIFVLKVSASTKAGTM